MSQNSLSMSLCTIHMWHHPRLRIPFLGLAPGGGIDWTQLGRSKWPLVAALGAGCLVGASGLFLVQVEILISHPIIYEVTKHYNQWLNSFISDSRGVWSWRRHLGPCPKSSHNSTPPSALCREGPIKNREKLSCRKFHDPLTIRITT